MKKLTILTANLLLTVWMAYGQWTYTNLSEAKFFMGSATVGNKVFFAGGTNNMAYLSDVEVYNLLTGTWAPAGNLFVPRFFVGGSVSWGTKIFFAGGYDDAMTYNFVDIYDTELQEWSVELLSVDRFSLAAVSHGDSVMFAGGIQIQGSPVFKNTIDIYNCETGEWAAPTVLSQARGGLAAAVVGDLALFAGGWINTSGTTSNRVDIYNFTTKTWSQASLSLARAYPCAVTVGSKVIVAGGITSINTPTTRVDIYDAETGLWTQASLSTPRSFSDNGAAVAGKAYFAGGGTFFGSGFNNPSDLIDVYDPETNTWTVMNLLEPRVDHSVIGVGNRLVVAGGKNNSGLLSSVEIYTAESSTCLPEGITFTTQEEIDNFQVNYPGCGEIEGDVTINGEDITNLDGLSVLTSIGGYLVIGDYIWPSGGGNPNLASLTGLENLTSIGDYLSIGLNNSLASLSGLENLISIGNDLSVSQNDSLTSLNGLENLTSIENDFSIFQNGSLTSLSGLENITSIGGDFSISNNNALTSLTGLENLTSIGGGLDISGALSNLTGLDNLTSIGGSLDISSNHAMINLTGLENLTSIGGGLFVGWNEVLNSLAGLDNLTSVEEGVEIYSNASLNSLDGLEGLTSIGALGINVNDVLTDLTGLDNLTSIGGDLWITANNSLSTCEAQWLCGYLSNPNGSINIFGNAEGCSNPPEVADACGITPFCLLYGNYHFYSQADVDDFQSDYPDCTELEGDVRIIGNDITNLNGLSVVTSIGNFLWMESNIALTSLTGLDNVTSIGGDLFIYNSALTSMTGLDNLTSIGGGLYIGHEYAGGNPYLNIFTGLNNLTSIGGELYIGWNSSLSSLTGLDNVVAESISNLTIIYNTSLATCEVQSICDYLASPNGSINIWNNATGCNNLPEVEAACQAISVEEIHPGAGISIIPNPTSGIITISHPGMAGTAWLTLFNVSGGKVIQRQLTDAETQLDISALPRGVYFVRLQDDVITEVGKIIKE